jgi:UDP-N-acetylmuramoylalanine--D-glutamate ligase
MSRRALVVGYGLSGRAATRWLVNQGWQVVVLEDSAQAAQAALGGAVAGGAAAPGVPATGGAVTFEVAPGPARAGELARAMDLVVPSPGVAVAHPAVVAAFGAGVEVCSEIELASVELDRRSGGEVLVAITGTNGKTTVTKLVAAMLAASGLAAVPAGNVGYPLLDAVGTLAPPGGRGAPATRAAARVPGSSARAVLVAEVSSFQLEYTKRFRPDVSCWLNFSPDHLDWHPTLDHYAHAKSKIWANQRAGSTVVVNADDPVVAAAAARVPAGVRVISFGTVPREATGARGGPAVGGRPTWSASPEGVQGPEGAEVKASELPRALPHDLSNTAAAIAVAMAAGATVEGCAQAARSTPAPPHRVEFVVEANGVRWYDDSKATTPASVLAGVRGFRSVVLIAGGRNKGLDLSVLAQAAPPVRTVVAIGEAAGEVASAFAGVAPVLLAASMEEAVQLGADVACLGDAVVLSPGCASFDWYTSYAKRGEHFASLVRAKVGEVGYQ